MAIFNSFLLNYQRVNPTSFRSETNLFSADLSHGEARQERPALIRRWLGRLVKPGRQRGQRLAVLIVSPPNRLMIKVIYSVYQCLIVLDCDHSYFIDGH